MYDQGGLTYENPELNLDAGFFYNVKGETLVLVGGGVFPDVYSSPFHSLRFNLKSFGKLSLSLNVENILNDTQEELFQSYRAEDQIYSRYSPNITGSIGIKYSFSK